MTLLYWFESIRLPALDAFMSLVTRLGEETFFMAAALFVFWCRDKRRGYYLLSVGFVGTLVNQWLKIVCRVPRPWVRDPNFTIVESAKEAAGGYSFPSGHTQSAAGWMYGRTDGRSGAKLPDVGRADFLDCAPAAGRSIPYVLRRPHAGGRRGVAGCGGCAGLCPVSAD